MAMLNLVVSLIKIFDEIVWRKIIGKQMFGYKDKDYDNLADSAVETLKREKMEEIKRK